MDSRLLELARRLRQQELKRYNYYNWKIRGEKQFIKGRNGDIKIFTYKPEGEGPFPVVFDMHGGGFILNDAELDDAFCHLLRKQLGAFMVNINYSKAPEKPYPAAIEDVEDVIRYFTEHAKEYNIDTNRMAIGGHSAGGNIAAAVTLKKEFNFKCQYIDFAVTELPDDPKLYEIDYSKPVNPEQVFNVSYCTPEQAATPFVSPNRASLEMLKGLPPAIILTGENDVLKVQAEEYGAKLVKAGVPVCIQRFLGAEHGFTLMFGTDVSRAACKMLVDGIKMFL